MTKHSHHADTVYVIVRQPARYPAVADTWSIAYGPGNELISHHESEAEARMTVKQYKAADAKRSRT